jgi:hypothetical protein
MADVFMLPTAPIRVNTRNEWLHGEDLINARVAHLFAKSVQVQDDGSYAVCVGRESQSILVDDTPFWVTTLSLEPGDGGPIERVQLTLSDGQHEDLDPRTLMQSADNTLYCRIVRQGFEVPCRFSPQQYHALAMHAQGQPGRYVMLMDGRRYPIAPYDRRPRPQSNN